MGAAGGPDFVGPGRLTRYAIGTTARPRPINDPPALQAVAGAARAEARRRAHPLPLRQPRL